MNKSRAQIQGVEHCKMFKSLRDCAAVLKGKEADYGRDNFVVASETASMITGKLLGASDVAACLIGIKLARYTELTTGSKEPVNESLDDTIKDLINYILLMERERRTDEVFSREQTDKAEEAG